VCLPGCPVPVVAAGSVPRRCHLVTCFPRYAQLSQSEQRVGSSRNLVTVAPGRPQQGYKISSPAARPLLAGVPRRRARTSRSLVSRTRQPAHACRGCIPGDPVARPGPAPPLPVRGDSRGSWRAIWLGWPACSPPCMPRPRNNAGAARYACPVRTPDRNSRMGPASLCPSRVASCLITGRPTTRSGKKTKEEPSSEEIPALYQSLEEHPPQEHPTSRRLTPTTFRLAATLPQLTRCAIASRILKAV